ncbi:unnamed protein product [Ectocarpus sp. CCAP 1310/34]|nr:unnamed protein product [Ectocarpus sp. CCAP 1310/34]
MSRKIGPRYVSNLRVGNVGRRIVTTTAAHLTTSALRGGRIVSTIPTPPRVAPLQLSSSFGS